MTAHRTIKAVPRLRQKGRLPEHTAHWSGMDTSMLDALFGLSRRVVSGIDGETPGILADPRFPDLALRQGVASSLRFLGGEGDETAHLREFGQRCYLDQLIRADGMVQAASEVMRAAEAADVRLLFLKGPTIARSVYDDEGDRPYSDLDVWVEGEDEANRLLEAIGLRPYPNARRGLLFDIRRFKCTLHVELPEVRGRRYHMELHFLPDETVTPEQMLIAGAGHFQEPAMLGGLPTIPTGALFPYLTLHLIHSHLGARLVWYQDLALFLRRGLESDDLDLMASWAERTRCLGILAVMIDRLEEYYGVAAGPRLRSLLPAGEVRKRTVLQRLTGKENIMYDFGGGTTSYFAHSPLERNVANLTWLFSYSMLFDSDGLAAVLKLKDRGVEWSVRFALHGTNLQRGGTAYRLCRALLLPIQAYLLTPAAAVFSRFLGFFLKRRARCSD